MSWIVIAVVVLLAAFGPLLWLRPSAKDKRLTALRARARTLNLNVDVKALKLLNPSASERVSAGGAARDHSQLLAVYTLILPRRLRHISGFRLLRAPRAGELPASRGAVAVDAQWLFDPDSRFPPEQGWPAVWEVLAPLAEQLPPDTPALLLGAREIGVFWAESAESGDAAVTALAATLEQMAAAVSDLDQRLAVQSNNDDS